MEPELQTRDKVVDLDEIIAKSNNKLLKSFPPFIMRIMKRILMQDELNEIHRKHKDKMGIDYTNAMLDELSIDVKMHNTENIQGGNRYIYVANHPLGGVDALSLLRCIHKLEGKVLSPSNELFNYVPNLRPLIVGVNVFGKNTKAKSEAIAKAFESDAPIMIFPAGKVSRKNNGVVRDLDWHKSFVSKAVQTQRDVVPVFISGENSAKFYRIARWRAFFKIKLTIETLFLPQEMFKKKGCSLDLVLGAPIPWSYFDKSKMPQAWANEVKQIVYDLGKTHLN
jgi:putative hemolysin